MVGVPGRSKGCVTCRKRKKGCNLERPECGQCRERGIPCGGYNADRVFIHQSLGSAKRGIPASATKKDQDAASAVVVGPTVPSRDMQIARTRYVSNKTDSHSHGPPRPASVILPAGLLRSAYSEKSFDAFVHMFIPHGDFRATNTEGKDFLGMLPLLSIREEALQLAVLAIGTATLGKTSNDKDLIRQARSFYGKALKETVVALRSPTRARSEAVFAIPRVMALFEMFYGAEANSNTQAVGWLSHAEGETALIVARGPEAYSESDTAHLMFVNARFRPLIAAFRKRKGTVLNEERWKTLPWRGRMKSPNDTLLDILCSITELLEAVDELASISAIEGQRAGLRVETISKCWALHLELEAWYTAHQDKVYTTTVLDPLALIFFDDIDTACLTVRYWVTSLLLYSSLDSALGIDPFTDSSISHSNRPHPRYFARLIARSVPYHFQEQYGITGATSISFPLGNTLYYMRNNPAVDKEYLDIIMNAWNDPMLPSAIRDFLGSMK